MANILNTNPIVIDTVGATSLIAKRRKIERIIWDDVAGGIAKGDIALVHDAAGGMVIWQCTASADDVHVNDSLGGIWFDGIYVTTLAHGKLYIYLSQIQ